MPNISDLPLEILDLIFSQVIGKRVRRGDEGGSQTAGLRLVCRAWADWLYEHHLYRLLTFADASEPLAFISLLGRRSKILPPAKCQHLEVHKIWTSEDPPPSDERNWINLKIVENSLDLFINLITLELGFLDFFNLPSQLIKAIGRFKGLQTLYLCYTYWRRCELDSTVAMDDPTWFNSLIMEVQTLKSLRLSLPLSLPCKPDPIKMAGTQYPSITHLTVNIGHLSLEVLLALCTAFKPTLKLLSIFDTALETDVQLLLPIYETLPKATDACNK
ncbi:hypothetical protein PCANC_06173 [Puccinia coronata f. sp. avenae]|uniref:Uncharacterized protein n=1 Tax=Puccinia coronata f. sp. avenae TaxID=200324 RepID=A0A2N5VTG8_9BASI|nr:hypothetical protein PCANC_06173 [Puccinia coronata f. sp. avenae]